MKALELTGKIFGKWTVLQFSHSKKNNRYWLCRCECGKEKTVCVAHLTSRASSSCGCPTYSSKHSAYSIWHGIITRCYLATHPNYQNYGARGITMCKEWRESPDVFVQWAISTGYKKGMSIERKDNEKGYSPDNCCWIPRGDQNYNKRNTHWVIWEGKKISLAKLIKEKGLSFGMVGKRLERGWSVSDAITKSKRIYKKGGDCHLFTNNDQV